MTGWIRWGLVVPPKVSEGNKQTLKASAVLGDKGFQVVQRSFLALKLCVCKSAAGRSCCGEQEAWCDGVIKALEVAACYFFQGSFGGGRRGCRSGSLKLQSQPESHVKSSD